MGYLYYNYNLPWSFSHQRQLMVFHWSLSDSKSQVSSTLLSILAVLNNVIVWMVSSRPPTSKSTSPFSNPLVTVPKAPILIGIMVSFMFHSLFVFSILLQGRGTYPSFHILAVLFCGQPGQQSRQSCKLSFFVDNYTDGIKLDGNYTRMLQAILDKSWGQHPTKQQLHGHLSPIKARQTRHERHCWRSRDELISDALLWTPHMAEQKQGD